MRDLTGVEWLTPTDAAQRLGIDRDTIYAWLQRGIIRTVRSGRHVAVNMPDVLDAERAWRRRQKGHPRHAAAKHVAEPCQGE